MKTALKLILATIVSLFFTLQVQAVTVYNQNVTAIFGSGNPDGNWVVDTGSGISLALRAKGRNDTPYAGTMPNDGAGTYTFGTQVGAKGPFNYEFSINSGTPMLNAYDFYLVVDQDHSAGVTPITINPLTHWSDNSYGTGATANGAGVEGLFSALGSTNSIAQNSQNITFGDYAGGALGLVPDATYTYELYAVASGAGVNGNRLASVSMNVVVGKGGAQVSENGSTLALLCAGLMSLGFIRRHMFQ